MINSFVSWGNYALFQMEVTSLYSSKRTGVTLVSIIAACVFFMFEVFCRPVPFQDYLFGMCGRQSNPERILSGFT